MSCTVEKILQKSGVSELQFLEFPKAREQTISRFLSTLPGSFQRLSKSSNAYLGRRYFGIFAMNWRNVRQSGGLQNEVFMFVGELNNFLCPSEGCGSV